MKVQEFLIESPKNPHIEHPEDLIFDGSKAALNAIDSLINGAKTSENVNIKFDGAPTFITGRINGKFVFTDKAGFMKQQFPSTSKEIFSMMYFRKPNDKGRKEFSKNISLLFSYIEKMIPKNFKGLIHFETLWRNRPTEIEGNFIFQPNIVQYIIPADSILGEKVSKSKFGIAIHSYFKNEHQEIADMIRNYDSLGLREVNGLVVLPSKFESKIRPNYDIIIKLKNISSIINLNKSKIDSFLNRETLSSMKITNLGELIKQYLTNRAGIGEFGAGDVYSFLQWIQSNNKLSEYKIKNVTDYVTSNKNIASLCFKISDTIAHIKSELFQYYHFQTDFIQAKIEDIEGHEGYVIFAPSGKIKLVNRPLFKNKNLVSAFKIDPTK